MKLCEVCGARYRGQPNACPLDGSPLTDLPDPLVGRTIAGRYVIEEKIGAGGMGTVYRAMHEVLERDVAVKFLASELAFDKQSRARFLREARAANRINHEHVIDITDYGETDDGLVYLVMEYLDGEPLDRLIRGQLLTPERSLRVLTQLAWALGRAHELDVVHRDIKPENIFLLQGHGGDFVKILDFGLAHVKGDLRLTASGTIFGTPEYMAPEQARGMRATPATDLYALGCVLFEMLTGRLPFEGATTALIVKHMREPPPRPSELVPALPGEVDDLVLRMLAKDPADRPANAFQIAEEAERLLDERTGRSRPPAPDPAVPAAEDRSPRTSGTRRLDRTASMEEAWTERIARFRGELPRIHPDGAPEWVRRALERLEARIAEVRRLRAGRDERIESIQRREEELRAMRTRIGRALDELARDEGQVMVRMAESEGPALEAARKLSDLEETLRRAWHELPPAPSPEARLSPKDVAALADLAGTASRWLELHEDRQRLEQTLEPWRQQRDDLRFQITQLKGRLASIGAEMDHDLRAAKQEAEALDKDVAAEIDALIEEAEPVMKHFLAFPEIRAALSSGSGAGAPGDPPRG